MKKFYIIGTLVLLALTVFGVVGYAYAQAQDDDPSERTASGCGMFASGNGRGNGARGMMGFRGNNQGNVTCPMYDGDEDDLSGYGPMHDYMVGAFAQALDLTPEELETRHQAGETLWEIAQEQGLSEEQFQEMMTTARTNALSQAVADGTLTQEQADFMLERMQRMFENGVGPGFGTGNNGCPHSRGGRWNNQP